MERERTIFSDFLLDLGVRHTAGYSDARFRSMPFHSLFGLSKLMGEYGVESEGYRLENKSELRMVRPPFLAQTGGGFVIVTSVGEETVEYQTQGEEETMPFAEFVKIWTGIIFVASPDAESIEPEYNAHRRVEFLKSAKKWVLAATVLFLLVFAIVSNGIYERWSQMLLVAFNIFGLWLSFMLVQKSQKITSKASDKVCAVLQEGGCDDILSTPASKFFGLFGWSEVGFSYFSISLLVLLIYPSATGVLALCNLCCLPFTCWSLWYQKFRAHHLCTLCVGVQLTLWCLFFCYLGGGWEREAFNFDVRLIAVIAAYAFGLLGLNALTPYIHKRIDSCQNDN